MRTVQSTRVGALWKSVALAAGALLGAAGHAQTSAPAPIPAAVQQAAHAIATDLALHCPLAPAHDGTAYDNCRKGLFGPSAVRAHLSPFILWGRQSAKADATLRQTNLTQFAPDVWTNMYAPLFMFNGKHTVEWVAHEKSYLVRLEAAFRNRLAPGQFPYPFWHEEAKWAMYENANAMLLWLAPDTARIRVAQFTDRGSNPLLQPVQHVAMAKYDGPWVWTDDKGKTQPAVTLFDGVYKASNPYIKPMDQQYRDLALQMRESQCTSCHVPNNPDKMSRLVLLSTPAHAAGEIDRLIKSVREDRMPMDEFRLSYALSPENKKWLLESAEAFKATVKAAREWEIQDEAKRNAGTSVPSQGAAALSPATPLRQPEKQSSTHSSQVLR